MCDGPGITCVRDVAWDCGDDGVARASTDCARDGRACAPRLGCVACVPNTVSCDGETVVVCNAEGSAQTRADAPCDAAAGLRCSREGCVDLCARAIEEQSYVGCAYWAVTTTNPELAPEFELALAVANPNLVPARVVLTRGGVEVASRLVAPGALETLPLPRVESLVTAREASVRERDGAYRVTSDVPVVVTQWNPLEFRLERDCAEEPPGSAGDGRCFSFTNDASLLLPESVLSGNYLVVSRATFGASIGGAALASHPGFVAIVAVDEGTTPLEIVANGHIAGTRDGTFAPMAPGESRTVSLERGEVLELVSAIPPAPCPGVERSEEAGGMTITYCDPGVDYDLTGTILRANGRIAVVSGHACAFVPYDRWACDHLEEQLFPATALGQSVLVTVTEPLRGEPNIIRIVSAGADNAITLEPPVVPTFRLGLGEHAELEITGDVRVVGTEPLLVAQFLVGQDYAGLGSGRSGLGDPAMALAIPEAQFRRSYTFLTPATYSRSYVSVIRPEGLRVVIDDHLVTDYRRIEGTVFETARVRVEGGVHRIDANAPFGIIVYGFGSYTSYLVPGGLDLRRISPPI